MWSFSVLTKNSQKPALESFGTVNWVVSWLLRIFVRLSGRVSLWVTLPHENSQKSALESFGTVNWAASWLLRYTNISIYIYIIHIYIYICIYIYIYICIWGILSGYVGGPPCAHAKFSKVSFRVVLHSKLSSELTLENFCQAMWEGLPVLTLPVVRMAGRVGASVVRAVGEGAVEIFMCIYAYYVYLCVLCVFMRIMCIYAYYVYLCVLCVCMRIMYSSIISLLCVRRGEWARVRCARWGRCGRNFYVYLCVLNIILPYFCCAVMYYFITYLVGNMARWVGTSVQRGKDAADLYIWVFLSVIYHFIHTGWRRLIGSLKLQIIFHKRATKYRSLLQKMTYKDKGSYESSPACISCADMYYLMRNLICIRWGGLLREQCARRGGGAMKKFSKVSSLRNCLCKLSIELTFQKF